MNKIYDIYSYPEKELLTSITAFNFEEAAEKYQKKQSKKDPSCMGDGDSEVFIVKLGTEERKIRIESNWILEFSAEEIYEDE